MITRNTVAKAKPRDVLRDQSVTGLELYIGKKRNTWRVYYRTKGDKTERRYKLGYDDSIGIKEARELARYILLEVAKGNDPAQVAKEKTLQEVYDEFIDVMSGKLKPKTLEGYEGSWRQHLKHLGRKSLTGIRRSDVAALHRRASVYAGNRALALLSRLFTYAHACDYVATTCNPTRGVERNTERPRRRFASGDELRRIGEGVGIWRLSENYRQRQFADLLTLIILTGARLNEIATSRCCDYDLDARRLHLPDSKTGEKDIHLPDALLPIIRRHHNSTRVYLFQHATLEAPVKSLDKLWKAFKEEFDLKDLRIHDLRRSYATYARSAGVSLEDISPLLGHSSSRTTERSYAFLKDDVSSGNANKISEELLKHLSSS